jgi:hypothetical protein
LRIWFDFRPNSLMFHHSMTILSIFQNSSRKGSGIATLCIF